MKATRYHILLGIVIWLGIGIAVCDEYLTYHWRMQLFGEPLLPETRIEACSKTYVYSVDGKILRYAEDVTQPDDWWSVFYHGDQEVARVAAEACLYLDQQQNNVRQEMRYDI